jgi:hypothetical protein
MFVLLVSATAFSAAETRLSEFEGNWNGMMSGLSVKLNLFVEKGEMNGTIVIDGKKENLNCLGIKDSISAVYFWRPADKACICLYLDNGQLEMAYFEKDSVRKISLRK